MAKIVRCTLADMIDRDILWTSLCDPQEYKGFTIGERGKVMFWYFCPTPNGYYKIYPQDENGNLGYPRYVDANKTNVVCWPV